MNEPQYCGLIDQYWFIYMVGLIVLSVCLVLGLSYLNNQYFHFGLIGGLEFECNTGDNSTIGDYMPKTKDCAVRDCLIFNELAKINNISVWCVV